MSTFARFTKRILDPGLWSVRTFVVVFVSLGILSVTGCSTQPAASEPTPAVDARAAAVELLHAALEAGSSGTTEEDRAESLQLAIDTLTTVCTDPSTTITSEAYDLLSGAQAVLENNGVEPCEVFR